MLVSTSHLVRASVYTNPHESGSLRDRPLHVLYLENDTVAGTDRHYTNGLKLAWFSREVTEWADAGWMGEVAEYLPAVNRPGGFKSFGFAFGQNIYTPQDITRRAPIAGDRPYAGWSYVEFNFVRKSGPTMDTLSVQLGIVGPHSYAEDVQKFVHARMGSPEPMGWDYQLRDEPTMNVVFERKGRISRRVTENLLRFDFVPHLGGSIGNVYTYLNAGATGRLGFNLPRDFGVDPIYAGAGLGATDGDDFRVVSRGSASLFVFVGVDGRVFARNLFLDGNTFATGPRVAKEAVVSDAYFGFGLAFSRWQVTYAYVRRSQEFKGQDRPNEFGSLTVFCTW